MEIFNANIPKYAGKLVLAEFQLIYKIMIFELFLTCGTNCVLADDGSLCLRCSHGWVSACATFPPRLLIEEVRQRGPFSGTWPSGTARR